MTAGEIRAAVHEALLPLLERMDRIDRNGEFYRRVTEALMARRTDPTHVTIGEAARIFRISESAARRRFEDRLEAIPGSKRRGIPVTKLAEAWVPERVARTARVAARKERGR